MDWRNLYNHALRLGFTAYEARNAVKRSEDMASSARELAERLPATSNTPQTVNAPEGSNLAPVEPFSEPVLVTEQPGAPRPQQLQKTSRGKECRPCTSDHFATCAGVLEEALRFARADGLENDEVVERVALCAEQMNAWERWDAAPESFEDLAEEDKAFLRQWLPKGRSFRHRLNSIQSMEDLEKVAAEAHRLHLNARKELRARIPKPALAEKFETEMGEHFEEV